MNEKEISGIENGYKRDLNLEYYINNNQIRIFIAIDANR